MSGVRYQRELTAAVLIPAVLALLTYGPVWGWTLLVALVSALALLEFDAMLATVGWRIGEGRYASAACLAALLAALAAAHLGSARLLFAVFFLILLGMPTWALLSGAKEQTLFPAAAGSAFATLYVAAGGAAIVALRSIGWRPVLFLLAVVWAGDSAAYYSGRRWGEKKLAPVISPKKTWVGLYGQMAIGTLAGVAFAALSSGSPVAGAGLGGVVSLAAVVGDLVESTFKRSCAIKDSGGLLPGHGGLLDRLDSLLYAGPILLGILTLYPVALAR